MRSECRHEIEELDEQEAERLRQEVLEGRDE